MNPRRLYRSSTDRWIGGVASGVADYFDVDPVLVRILWIISVPFTGGLTLLAYIVMLIVVPEEPADWPQPSPWQPGGAPLGYAANFTPPAGPTDPSGNPAPGSTPSATPDPSATGPAPEGTPVPNQTPPTQGWDWRWNNRQDRWQRRADRWQRRADRWQGRGNGGLVFGVLLIVVGGLLAWHQLDPRLDLSLAWPIAVVLFGAFLVASSVGFDRND